MMDDLISRQAAIEEILECCSSDFDSEYECGYDDGLRQGVHRLKHLPPAEHQWIPVTERLPLYGQDVLAVRTYGDGEKCQEVLMAHIAVWNEETGEKWWNATNITHWMPLPEPPKEE